MKDSPVISVVPEPEEAPLPVTLPPDDEPIYLGSVFERDEDETSRGRWRESGFVSIILHLAALLALITQPSFLQPKTRPAEPGSQRQVTYLFIPPPEPTPPVRIEPPPLPPREALKSPPPLPPPQVALPQAPPPELPVTARKAPQPGQPTPQATPPAGEHPASNTPGLLPVPPPPSGQQRVGELALGNPRPTSPLTSGQSIEDTMRSIARQRAAGGGTQTYDPLLGRIDARNPGGIGGVEIKSDTMGVDFNPYLQRVLWDIRNNWYAVMPEIARMGRKGRVLIQFEILRNGVVPKLYLISGAGLDALDRAALAGISASSPFQPLPPEFKGELLRLQITFLYNLAPN